MPDEASGVGRRRAAGCLWNRGTTLSATGRGQPKTPSAVQQEGGAHGHFRGPTTGDGHDDAVSTSGGQPPPQTRSLDCKCPHSCRWGEVAQVKQLLEAACAEPRLDRFDAGGHARDGRLALFNDLDDSEENVHGMGQYPEEVHC